MLPIAVGLLIILDDILFSYLFSCFSMFHCLLLSATNAWKKLSRFSQTATCFGKIEPASPSGFSGITDLSLLQNIVILQQNAANNRRIIACLD